MANRGECLVVAHPGRAAEMLSPRGLPGAALDEVVYSKAIAEFAARKLNVDAEELWQAGVWRPAQAACRLNRDIT